MSSVLFDISSPPHLVTGHDKDGLLTTPPVTMQDLYGFEYAGGEFSLAMGVQKRIFLEWRGHIVIPGRIAIGIRRPVPAHVHCDVYNHHDNESADTLPRYPSPPSYAEKSIMKRKV